MKVNLGCGEFYAEGWTNVDRTEEEDGPQPDVIASATDLPFPDGSVSQLYAGHVLEHVALETVPDILAEIKRVLSPEGMLMIVGPDIDRARESYPEAVEGILHGDCRWEGDEHLWESRESTVVDLLNEGGWFALPIPITDVKPEWPVTSRIGWQFAILAQPVA